MKRTENSPCKESVTTQSETSTSTLNRPPIPALVPALAAASELALRYTALRDITFLSADLTLWFNVRVEVLQ